MDPLQSSEGLSFDLKAIIDQTGLDLEEYLEIFELFRDSFQELMGEISTGLVEKDFDKIMRGAHTLKGAAGNIGFNCLSEMAREIQEDSGNEEMVSSLIPQMQGMFLKIEDEITSIRQ